MKKLKLNNGIEMPMIGYGVYQIAPDETEKYVLDALNVGYRAIDTAQAYYNEDGVGSAVKRSGLTRDEVFLTTKVWISNSGYARAKASIDESLRKLQTNYIDLLLIHQPFGDYYGTYRAMEEAYKDGKIRAIGLSNFFADRFIDLVEHIEIKPAINQMETHVFNQQVKSQEIIKEYGTHLESWSPLAQGEKKFFDNDLLNAIGKKYNKSVAQVGIRFLIERNIIVIPKSVNKVRMIENLDVFDFSLSDQEMQAIIALDQGKSLFADHTDPELVRMLLNYGK